MKLLLVVVAGLVLGLVLLVGIVALVGSQLPPDHVASRSILLRRSPPSIPTSPRSRSTSVKNLITAHDKSQSNVIVAL